MKALVTGGGGFLGKAIVKALLKRGDDVKTIQRNSYPQLIEWGAKAIQGDLTQLDDVIAATKDCEMVFHVAAKAGVWGAYKDYYQSNVIATKNVLKACRTNHIHYLVYTSTPSVVFNGKNKEGINESVAYVRDFFNAYQKTKAEAEQLVIDANDKKLKTVSLRPHLIWGPDDPHLVPRIINRAKSGRLRLIGQQRNKVDSCYIDNAVKAHILAADCLISNEVCSGKVYFVGNDEPIVMSCLINKILDAAGLSEVNKTIPENIAYLIGTILEKIYTLLKIKNEPILTRFVVRQLASSHWFDLSAAKHDFGYAPEVSINEGMARLKQSLSENSKQ